jgi:tetratricopeptide (TPR) repeat protein
VLGEANCTQTLGDVALQRSDIATARQRYEAALALYRQIEDVLGEANCTQSLGDIAFLLPDHEVAEATYERALSLYRRIGDLLGEANCIQSLGDIALGRSADGSAYAAYEQALVLYTKVSAPLSIGWMRLRLSRTVSNEDERARHRDAARVAWASIDRVDLIEKYLG